MFSSMPSNWSSVSSWLGVGQRPSKDDGGDENKENTDKAEEVKVKDSEDSAISTQKPEEGNSPSSSNSNSKSQEKSSEKETESTSPETESNTTSPAPTPTVGDEQSQSSLSSPLDNINLEEVSAKALNTAKEFGSILFSFGKTATKHVTETATQFKHVVEEKTILGEFAKQQESFCSSRREASHKAEAAVPPWVGYNDEDVLKQQILQLSQDKRNFVRNPPSGVQFQFDFEACFPVAMATLQEDKSLEKMRFDLVPKAVNEETFWRNYFYRVSLIRQSSQLSSSLSALEADEAMDIPMDLYHSTLGSRSSSRRSSTGTSGSDPKAEKDAPAPHEEPLSTSPPDNDDFVSDAFEESGLSEDDIRREMEQQIKGDKPVQDAVIEDADVTEDADEEEWEKELMEEIMEEMKE